MSNVFLLTHLDRLQTQTRTGTLADEGHEHSDAEDALQKAEAKEEKPKKSNEHSKEDDEKL